MIETFFLFAFKYDVVHINAANLGIVAYAASFLHCKYIFTIHGCPHPTLEKTEGFRLAILSFMSSKLLRTVASRAAKVYTISEFSQFELLNNYKIHAEVVYNGFDQSCFQFNNVESVLLKRKYQLDDKCVFISVGRMVECKKPYQVIDVFEKLNLSINNAYLIFIGEGILRTNVIKYAKEKGLINSILFIPFVDFQKMPQYYAIAKYFISGCEIEGFGLVALEACACGCFPILPNRGAFPEIFCSSKFLYDVNDIKNIRLFEYDLKLKKLRGEILKRFSWHESISKYELVYRSLKEEKEC